MPSSVPPNNENKMAWTREKTRKGIDDYYRLIGNFKKGQKGNRIFVQEIAKFIAKPVTVYYALQISKTVTIIESLRYFTFSLRSSY